ncbi:hypothetical protein Fmac_001485 [Flemingia macrophylla]|uniref:Uncharacterized protein n=1 Tax=Flemingia macrophylla TaxID=520843 RepID=A0ABD1NH90_9FABA
MAPGRCSTWMNQNCNGGDSAIEPYLVTHHQLLAHAATVHVYKTKYQLANVSQSKQSTTAAAQVKRNRSRRFEKTKEQGEVKEKKNATKAIVANLTVELLNSREESRPEPFTTEDLEADIF